MVGCFNQQSEVNTPFIESKDCTLKPFKGASACMVNSEIGAVLAVMRRNVRWGFRSAASYDDDQLEHPLVQSFKELRKNVFSWQCRWNQVDPLLYLRPFLDVIQSDETGAPITGVALSSVYKFLTLEIIDSAAVNVDIALHRIVDTVTSCRFEVTDPASEEVVLMKILQVLLACVKRKASGNLSNHHVCNIVNTCFRLVHQASAKSELLQRIARHTMHELVRHIFSYLPNIGFQRSCPEAGHEQHDNGENSMMNPYGVPCMVEIFHFLCSLLNVTESFKIRSRSNPIAYDEDVPLFALGLINSAIEVSGSSLGNHPELLSLVQKELFHNLMHFGLSMSPLILSTVCSIVLNLYHHMRSMLKLQLEAFFSGVLLHIARSKHGASYQQQEVAMETLVDFCRQVTFMPEMYANFDCDISCRNVFEDLTNLLSKSSFPVNSPVSSLNLLALDGLIAVIVGMAEGISQGSVGSEQDSVDLDEYGPFWTEICEDCTDPNHWVPFVCKMKHIKRKLATGVDHFNRDPKKGMEFLQGVHLLPDRLDPKSVACFFRYTTGLDKNIIGDFLGSHEDFYIQVLHEFSGTFDFRGMNLDTALRILLETFRLPGESQKIQRVLEAFSERYYEQSPNILADKDAALVLAYSLILLNTDQHNTQVKKKMTEEDFIRNNRRINGGNDLPREFLSELYHSICENEIRINTPDRGGGGIPVLDPSHWIGLVHRQSSPYIICDPPCPYLDYDMFAMLSGPAIASISVVLDNVEQEDSWKMCIDGFLAIAKVAGAYNFSDVLNDLVVSLCKFTTLLLPSYEDEFIVAFAEDGKARLATIAVFTIASKYGDHIRSGWKSVVECILSLHKTGLLPARLFTDAADDLESGPRKSAATLSSSVPSHVPRRSSGLMGVFSQLLYLDAEEEPAPQPTEQELAAREQILQTIQSCNIDSIFAESKFLQADSLSHLVRALVSTSGDAPGRKGNKNNSPEAEETAIFCLELLIAITINNRDRIMLLWKVVYDHIASIVQLTKIPCSLVEKAVFGLLRICQRLLPYKENLTDELLKSLQLILKLDARVADAFLEQITKEIMHLVKANAMQIRSHTGWRTIISLLSFTARHPEASGTGFETLSFVMVDGAHLLPANYILCLKVAAQFADSPIGNVDRSVRSLDLMGGSHVCLVRWSHKTKEAAPGEEATVKMTRDITEMWLRLVLGLRKFCLDRREEVRGHAILMLQRCLTGVDGVHVPKELWSQCFDQVIFTLLDELLKMDYTSTTEGEIILALKLMFKVLLQSLQHLLSESTSFCKLWLGVLELTERCVKVKFKGKHSEKIPELIPEILKNTLLVMKTSRMLVPSNESFWKLTWSHVHNICPSLQSEVFPSNESDDKIPIG